MLERPYQADHDLPNLICQSSLMIHLDFKDTCPLHVIRRLMWDCFSLKAEKEVPTQDTSV